VALSTYEGPSVFGFETDMLRRAAAISVHTSPLATLGSSDAGGMNVYVRELSCHVGGLGIPVDVYTRRTDPEAPQSIQICDNVTVININAGPAAPLRKSELFRYLPEFAHETALYALRAGLRYDVVHAHYWLSGWVAHLLKRYWETPFVQMFHTTAHMKNAVAAFGQHESDQRVRIERELIALADSIIAANPDERADLIWRQHASAEKTCTIPPGVDTQLFRPLDRSAAREELGLDADAGIVLFVGRIDPIKGIDVLLRAAAELPPDPARLFVFVGGDLDETGQPLGTLAGVEAQARELGVADRCRFVGAQPQDRLPVFYSAADIVAVPSLYESFGLVAVEAMACGVPVVASRAGGLTFTVEDGRTGSLVPPGEAEPLAEAIARLLADPALRARLGANAHEAAQRFSWDSIASSVAHLYYRLAAGRPSNMGCRDELFAEAL
jgi:D-inositol-3-phosphate glycosyltransferase